MTEEYLRRRLGHMLVVSLVLAVCSITVLARGAELRPVLLTNALVWFVMGVRETILWEREKRKS